MLLQYKKQIQFARFPEAKLGTYTITQSKRDLINEDLRKNTLVSLSLKRHRFISLQMLYIKKARITFHISSLGCPRPCNFQQWRISRMLLGMTQETLKMLRTKC
jgi:hypothetical protein